MDDVALGIGSVTAIAFTDFGDLDHSSILFDVRLVCFDESEGLHT
jgi:hypothetical protein